MTFVGPSTESWGIRPVLFRAGGFDVPSYTVLVLLGIAAGVILFFHESRRTGRLSEHGVYVFLAALVGGVIGAKLPVLVLHAREIAAAFPDLRLLFSGRTIVGGLVGGAAGVWIAKRALGIRGRHGDAIAVAVCAGLALGRMGCFLRGCCYGRPTSLPWGVDFGDGIARHPAQLYESAFAAILLVWMLAARPGEGVPGRLFRLFMVAYFVFRFMVEFVREETLVLAGLSGFQLVSAAVLAYYGFQLLRPPFRAAPGQGGGCSDDRRDSAAQA